jgi:hypothetical protein
MPAHANLELMEIALAIGSTAMRMGGFGRSTSQAMPMRHRASSWVERRREICGASAMMCRSRWCMS